MLTSNSKRRGFSNQQRTMKYEQMPKKTLTSIFLSILLKYRLFASTGFTATFNDSIVELNRGIRTHFVKIMKKLADEDMTRAQLGLGHSFSRTKCATDVNR